MMVNRAERRALASNARRANAARGETILELETGEKIVLCFTLRAMAEIEAGLGIDTIVDMEKALEPITAKKLSVVLGALARGGGDPEFEDAEALEWQITIPEAVAAIGAAFAAASVGAGSDAKN